MFEERYKKLNAEQKNAVDTIDGPVLVVAGPGSGKTEILSLRVANILRKTDTHPGSILCLTFTESAATNMRERLSGLIGTDAYRVQIHTFHSFGVSIINRFPEFFFGSAEFNPADTVTQMETMSEVIADLPASDPLRSEHPKQGFVFLKPALDAVSNIKRAGLSPDEFRAIIEHNSRFLEKANPVIAEVFSDRLSKKDFEGVRQAALAIRGSILEPMPVPHLPPLSAVLADSLLHVLSVAEEEGKTAPLSEWKSAWTTKSETGERVLKETERTERMLSLSSVYARYQSALYAKGYYDFDDMLLETTHQIEKNPSLSLTIQEEFQYILVDEFQDTNDAQMRLLRLLSSASVHEGRPNVMAVGDADQAIYKFQGAEIANIVQFKNIYRDPVIITLSKNYRSSQEILDLAGEVINQGENNLEAYMPEVKKVLSAENGLTGDIAFKQFPTYLHEYQWIAAEIKKLLESGTSPDDIAVISRTHAVLQGIVPYLRSVGVPIAYDKQQDVLASPYIRELVTVVRFLASVAGKKEDEADHLLPEILSFAWWGLPRKLVWDISVEAKEKDSRWLAVMENHSDRRVQRIAAFLIHLGVEAQSEPVERILDSIIGSRTLVLTDTESDEFELPEEEPAPETGFESPFREYYFGSKILKEKGQYITFLSGLRVFIGALREYKQGLTLSTQDFVSFVDIYEKNNMQLLDTSPFMSASSAVELLTAHKSKGLEFPIVFVAAATDSIWAPGGRGDVLPFPKNLAIRPGSDNRDDALRLLYVALTRAKHTLRVSYHIQDEKGKSALPVEFLSYRKSDQEIFDAADHPLESAWSLLSVGPFSADEEAMLRRLVEAYCMPVTHLNNFLDITKGGPRLFLEQNLLRFPQAKTVSSVYGTAIHAAMQYVYTYMRREGALPPLSRLLEVFKKQIAAGRLGPVDTRVQYERGEKALTLYYQTRSERFDPSYKIETDFSHQGVCVGSASVTGKIDKMILSGDQAVVVDWKTGKPKISWQAGSFEAIQLRAYKTQLMFYKLLIENSKDYRRYEVKRGVLEFLEPVRGGFVDLELEIDPAEVSRLRALVEIVYKKICNLDFPDVSGYTPDLSGITAFENDLLEGKV